jgi:hypothetical protein
MKLADTLLEKHLQEILDDPTLDEGVRDSLRVAQKFVKTVMVKIVKGMKQEKQETKDMIRIFIKMLSKKLGKRPDSATPEEVKAALDQLKDISKVAVVALVMFGPLPGDEPILIGIELLAKKFGFSIFPSALRDVV